MEEEEEEEEEGERGERSSTKPEKRGWKRRKDEYED